MPSEIVVVPTYNEREMLPLFLEQFARAGGECLIVDDSSPDGTGELADDLARDRPWLHVLHRPHKGGLGAAYLARWVGEQSGLASFHHLLATLPVGAHLRDSLTLGASAAIAFWPLAAGLVAGGMEAFATRDRDQGAADQPVFLRPWPAAGQPGQSWLPGSPSGLPGSQPEHE